MQNMVNIKIPYPLNEYIVKCIKLNIFPIKSDNIDILLKKKILSYLLIFIFFSL